MHRAALADERGPKLVQHAIDLQQNLPMPPCGIAIIGSVSLVLAKGDGIVNLVGQLVKAHLDTELMTDMAGAAVPLLAQKPKIDLMDTISAHDLA